MVPAEPLVTLLLLHAQTNPVKKRAMHGKVFQSWERAKPGVKTSSNDRVTVDMGKGTNPVLTFCKRRSVSLFLGGFVQKAVLLSLSPVTNRLPDMTNVPSI